MWVDPAERARFAQHFEVQGELRGYKCQFKRKDNSVIWVSLNVRRVLDSEGRPLRHEGFIQDITVRKRAEMQLRDSEERYRSTFEQAVVGIVHSSFHGRLLRGNAQFAHMLGYAPEELCGLTIRQLTAPEDLPASVDAIQRILSGAVASETLEKRHLRKDGSLTWSRMTVSAQRDGQGRPLHPLALAEDINARESAEARWAAADPARLIGLRNRNMLAMGYAGAFMREELAGSRRDCGLTEAGLVITLNRGSKTAQKRIGDEQVAIPCGHNPDPCPVLAFLERTREAGISAESDYLYQAVDCAGRLSGRPLIPARSPNSSRSFAAQPIWMRPMRLPTACESA